ncbi:MAG: hypothetical protein IKY98_00845, partial [Alphaproteobacteria bacterium]|nr:hypothetical protein [Alphaproteobacteria bacterium]
MAIYNSKSNNDFNFIVSDTMPLDTPVKAEYDTEQVLKSKYDKSKFSSCHSRAITRESRKKEIMPTGYSCQSTNMTKGDNTPSTTRIISQSGRSMVEMLGTLAIMGVLSIGGIMGYSYGMDKYRANDATNQIMLRAIDLMMQAANNHETLTLAGWNNESAQYDFGDPEYTADDLIKLDVGTASNPIPKRVCEQIFEGMKSNTLYIDINGREMDADPECDTNNIMTFYFEGGNSQMDVCNPACGENEYCDNGICLDGDKPLGTHFIPDVVCTTDADCNTKWTGYCALCYTKIGKCVETGHEGKDCTLNEGNVAGQCNAGQCLAKGCNDKTPCANDYEYCASTNSSSYERFSYNEMGTCVEPVFKEYEIQNKIYYVLSSYVSWWDADASCQAL